MPLPNDYSRCGGRGVSGDFGDPSSICPERDGCARFRQFLDDAWETAGGWHSYVATMIERRGERCGRRIEGDN